MLSREQAEKLLKTYEIEDGLKNRARQVLKLPDHLKQMGLLLIGLDENLEARRSGEWNLDLRVELKKLSQAKRHSLFTTLYGQLAEYVKGALSLPHAQGNRYSYTPFRTFQSSVDIQWLHQVFNLTCVYDQPLSFFAIHAQYSYYYGDSLVPLLVCAINKGEQEILDILVSIAKGEHTVGAMGNHVIYSLLQAENPVGWETIEKLLLAAQRQEGLRQSIFHGLNVAHPKAFVRMLSAILEHDLIRFSATVQMLQQMMPWVQGKDGEVATAKQLEGGLKQLMGFLTNPDQTEQLARDTQAAPSLLDWWQAHWCLACQDTHKAADSAVRWLNHSQHELRFAAIEMIGATSQADRFVPELWAMIEDPDLRVVGAAMGKLPNFEEKSEQQPGDYFQTLERLYQRVPQESKLEPLIPWGYSHAVTRYQVTQRMIAYLGQNKADQMLPYWDGLNDWHKSTVLAKIAEQTPWNAQVRNLVVEGLGNEYLRNTSLAAFEKHQVVLEPAELLRVEKLLTRKKGDLRRGVIGLILKQSVTTARESATRLASLKNAEQKAAGEEVLRQLEQAKSPTDAPSLKDALGLFNPAQLTPPKPLECKEMVFFTPAAEKILESLGQLVDQHAQDIVRLKRVHYREEDSNEAEYEVALGNARLPLPDGSKPLEEDKLRLPLIEVWQAWNAGRKDNLKDSDGLELLRAWMLLRVRTHRRWGWGERPEWIKEATKQLLGEQWVSRESTYPYPNQIDTLLRWLLRLDTPVGLHDFALDAAEHSLAVILPIMAEQYQSFSQKPADQRSREESHLFEYWRTDQALTWVGSHTAYLGDWTRAHDLRFWQIFHSANSQVNWKNQREQTDVSYTIKAWEAGIANEADVYDQVLGERFRHDSKGQRYYGSSPFFELQTYSQRKPHQLLEEFPRFKQIINRCRERILEIETGRGDLSTAASTPAMAIQSVEGAENIIRLLQGLGRYNFVRGYIWSGETISDVMSHLIRVTFPAETDTPESFAKLAKAAKLSETRLIELGVYAPQWARFVERALGWKGFADATLWLHAHTKGNDWNANAEIKEVWKAEMSEQTPLSAQDLIEGVVDVSWFQRVHQALGKARWAKVYEAAKYASSGNGHSRARMFSDAMLGQLEEKPLTQRIKDKRNQDAVRALGLLPLPKTEKTREIQTLSRYETIQTFVKGSKQFGSQRRESEALAARIGLHNLANTAGYPDPQRLTWAMEMKAVADLARGAIKLERDDTSFTLSINEQGEPEFTMEKKGKPLAEVPAKHKKDPEIVAMRSRKKELEDQASRMRLSLERSMVQGDWFGGKELATLLNHPILHSMLQSLVWIGGQGQMGYLGEQGQVLLDLKGHSFPLDSSEAFRIAHPHDLLESKQWSQWQHECFESGRKQPFKQVFRELYLPTEAERQDRIYSSRYAGHQVNPKQAMALIGSRGWVSRHEEGISKTFHSEGITVWLESSMGWTTPAEVEAPTIQRVSFTRKGQWERLELSQIPPRLFSEVMRDLDLVVSVAHVGGVDLEASQSTVEMRATLVRETAALLKLKNVSLEGNFVQIQGSLNRYTVHLGSATVHQQPGGYLCIVAVPSQHRGRIFLPFADNDPRTAEVVSKVLLLAQDEQIKDPSILRQIV